MKALISSVLAAAIIAGGVPPLAPPQAHAESDAVLAEAQVPAGTVELDAYQATLQQTLNATWRNYQRLRDCKSWVCFLTYAGRIDNVLTRGIRWMYSHPALPCYQAQQQRATKGLQELRGGFRMLVKAVSTGEKWRIRVATRKIQAAGQIFDSLPAHTCPA